MQPDLFSNLPIGKKKDKNFKIGLLSFAGDFAKPGNSGAYRDYTYVKNELSQIGEVTDITKENVVRLLAEKFDFFFVMSFQANFYGGVVNEVLLNKWRLIFHTYTPVFYFFVDFNLPISKLHEIVKRRFNIDLPIPAKNQVRVISYAEDIEGVRKWWNNGKNIETEAFQYFDLGESYFKHTNILSPKQTTNRLVYVGNYRNGKRTKVLGPIAQHLGLDIYGKWRIPIGFAKNFNAVREDEVQSLLNTYFGQIITYDDIGIKYKSVVTRLALTVASGSLPIIDRRLEYLKVLPPDMDPIMFSSAPEIYPILDCLSESDRSKLIESLQSHFTDYYSRQSFAKFVKDYYVHST